MQLSHRKSIATFIVLSLPVVLLGAFAWHLNKAQPDKLIVARITTKKLPSRNGEDNMQMIVFLSYPKGNLPKWWGEPVNSQSQDLANLNSGKGQLSFTMNINRCSYDPIKKQYRVPVHYVVPSYGRWKQQVTVAFLLALRQGQQQKGVVKVETVRPSP